MRPHTPIPPSRPMTPGPITYLNASCHCGLNEFRAAFPTDALPISNDLCHCNTCRHSSGQMAVYHVNVSFLLCRDTDTPFVVDGSVKGRSSPSGGDGDLIAYRTSENAIRYFCSVCSAHLIFRYLGTPKVGGEEGEREGAYLCVAAGALERTEGIVQPGYHIWIEDTLDGGLADHLRTIGYVTLPRYRRGPKTEELPLGWRSDPSVQPTQPPDQDKDELHFTCHCKTLQFKITRPNDQSYLPHAPFPDLLHPYDTAHLAKLRNSGDVKWWLRPLGAEKPTKYFAGHCACTYCRMTSGFEIQSWVYVPRQNIIVDSTGRCLELKEEKPDELEEVKEAVEKLGIAPSPVPPEEKEDGETRRKGTRRMKGLKQYISSPGRYRESCQNCGATAFAWQAGRPDLICVAVALVDETQGGARAEDWLDWCLTRVGFSEQALSPKTVEGMMRSLRAVAHPEEDVATETPLKNASHVTLTTLIADDDTETKEGLPIITVVEEVTASA